MPRVGTAYTLANANPHTQMNSGAGPSIQTLTLEPTCNAVMVSAKTANAFVTFDNSAPSATVGIEIVSGAQPVLIPLGYYAHSSHALKMIGAAANGILNVVQLQ